MGEDLNSTNLTVRNGDISNILIPVEISLRILAILLHTLGLVCIYLQKERRDNQKIFLVNLSIVEITIATLALTKGLDRLPLKQDSLYHRIALSFHGGICLVLYLVVYFLTLDRLVCVLLNLKYKYYITKKRIWRVMVVFWISGLLCTIWLYVEGVESATDIIYVYGFTLFDSIFVVIALMTYLTIANKLRNRKKSRLIRRRKRTTRGQIVPFLIITSFMIFYGIPDFTVTFTSGKRYSWYVLQVATVAWTLQLVADPVIYIFLHPKNKLIAFQLLTCQYKCSTSQQNSFIFEPNELSHEKKSVSV